MATRSVSDRHSVKGLEPIDPSNVVRFRRVERGAEPPVRAPRGVSFKPADVRLEDILGMTEGGAASSFSVNRLGDFGQICDPTAQRLLRGVLEARGQLTATLISELESQGVSTEGWTDEQVDMGYVMHNLLRRCSPEPSDR